MQSDFIKVIFLQEFEKEFLFLLKTALNDEKLPDGYSFDVDRVFVLAQQHNLLPFVFSKATETEIDFSVYKNKVMRLCGLQINKNLQFEALYDDMKKNGLEPVVVKGPICAAAYKTEYLRLSSDFDIVFSLKDAEKYEAYFVENGFVKNGDTYTSADRGLYIETSSRLGEGDDVFARNADIAFAGFSDRAVWVDGYRTLSFDEHFVYLLYHAFKHFIGSGFGLKQLSDIYMYIKKYKNNINYSNALLLLEQIGIKSFADNCFFAIMKTFDFNDCELFSCIDFDYVCYDDFLKDLLDAGVFGKSTEDRLHSASVVHNTVASDGKKNILKTLFPSYLYMKVRYKVLEKIPILLPVFWIVRIVSYLFDSVTGKKAVSPKESLVIANERIELMKKMGIL